MPRNPVTSRPVNFPPVAEYEMEASGKPQGHAPLQENPRDAQCRSPQDPSKNDESEGSCNSPEGELQCIYPTLPTSTKRYDLGRTINDEQADHFMKPLQTDYTYTRRGLHEDWVVFVHPEGLPFFCLPATNIRPMRILTEAWLYDEDMMGYVQDFIHEIENFILAKRITIPPNSDLVLEPVYNPNARGYRCGYYFVYHPGRVLFWLQKFNLSHVSDSFGEIKGSNTPSQTASYLEVEYWAYWDTFPNVQELTPEIYDYTCDVITSSMTDVVSSDDSTVAHSYETLRKMLDIVQACRECKTSNWHIGRFMRHIVHNRFRNYYAQKTARLTRRQSVFTTPAEPGKPSKLLTILSPLLFCIPDIQVTNMRALWVDRLAVKIHWNKLFEDLMSEWSQTTALATILLTANGAFLAIPLFGSNERPDSHSSLAQVMSYLSLLISLSSIILGLIMYRQHRKSQYCSVDGVLEYLEKHKNSTNKLEHLALLLSLPYALLMWSVVTFLAAFLVMCFDGTLAVTRICMGCAAAFNSILIVWCIVKFWDTKSDRWESALGRAWGHFRGLFVKRSRKKQGSEESAEEGQIVDLSDRKTSPAGSHKHRPWIVGRDRRGRRVVQKKIPGFGLPKKEFSGWRLGRRTRRACPCR